MCNGEKSVWKWWCQNWEIFLKKSKKNFFIIVHSEFFSYNSDCFCIPAREISIFHYSYFVLKTVTFWQLEPITKTRQKCWHASKKFIFFCRRIVFAIVLLWFCCACVWGKKCLFAKCKLFVIYKWLQNCNHLQIANCLHFANNFVVYCWWWLLCCVQQLTRNTTQPPTTIGTKQQIVCKMQTICNLQIIVFAFIAIFAIICKL